MKIISVFMLTIFLLVGDAGLISNQNINPDKSEVSDTSNSSYSLGLSDINGQAYDIFYLYDDDLTTANLYKSALESWGFTVKLSDCLACIGYYNNYSLTILGADLYDPWYNYDLNTGFFPFLDSYTGKFLSLGQTGDILGDYFDLEVSSWLAGGNSWTSSVSIVNQFTNSYRGLPALNELYVHHNYIPNPFVMYNTTGEIVYWNTQYLDDDPGVELISYLENTGHSIDRDRSTIIVEDQNYLFWGYPEINKWTDWGSMLFENVVRYLFEIPATDPPLIPEVNMSINSPDDISLVVDSPISTAEWMVDGDYGYHSFFLRINGSYFDSKQVTFLGDPQQISFNIDPEVLGIGVFNYTLNGQSSTTNEEVSDSILVTITQDTLLPQIFIDVDNETNPYTLRMDTYDNLRIIVKDTAGGTFSLYINGTHILDRLWTNEEDEEHYIYRFLNYSGIYNVTVEAWDNYGNYNKTTQWITVLSEPNPPAISSFFGYSITRDASFYYYRINERYPNWHDVYVNSILVNDQISLPGEFNPSPVYLEVEIPWDQFAPDIEELNITIVAIDTSGNEAVRTYILSIEDNDDTGPPTVYFNCIFEADSCTINLARYEENEILSLLSFNDDSNSYDGEIRLDGVLIDEFNNQFGYYYLSLDLSTIEVGSYEIDIYLIDALAKVTSLSFTLIVIDDIFALDEGPPIILFDMDPNQIIQTDQIDLLRYLVIYFTIIDNFTITDYTYSLTHLSSGLNITEYTVSGLDDSMITTNLLFEYLEIGEYQFTLSANDQFSKYATESLYFTIVYDRYLEVDPNDLIDFEIIIGESIDVQVEVESNLKGEWSIMQNEDLIISDMPFEGNFVISAPLYFHELGSFTITLTIVDNYDGSVYTYTFTVTVNQMTVSETTLDDTETSPTSTTSDPSTVNPTETGDEPNPTPSEESVTPESPVSFPFVTLIFLLLVPRLFYRKRGAS